ncbi:MAG: succinate dehydrogenase, hydrophobic membrane anchor protein [Woeseiaceae bacterium]|nr:succinate dehydrogenase, hydrophobic membrane anchor protein [Woeseiaceae bacterium]
MSLRTPLSRVLGLGSAKEGTDHWWAQRVSGVALVLLGFWFSISLARLEGLAFGNVFQFIAQPANGVLLTLLCITVAYHSYLGIQVVIEDYVHGPALKVASLVLSRFAHVLVAVASVYSILRIGFGA